jgi:hypothetical protein
MYVYRHFDTGVSPVSYDIFCADNKGLGQLAKNEQGARLSEPLQHKPASN